MSNQEEKKCECPLVTEFRPNGTVWRKNCDCKPSEEKKCEHDRGDKWVKASPYIPWAEISKEYSPSCIFCKLSEAKQEPEWCECNDPNHPGEHRWGKQKPKNECKHEKIKPFTETSKECPDCGRHLARTRKPMTNIKTPEEIAKEICSDLNLFDHNGKPSIECSTKIAYAISAERNANLEKIRELEIYKEQKINYDRLFQKGIYLTTEQYDEKVEQIKSLESKLAEAEKELNDWKKYQDIEPSVSTLFEQSKKITLLEAEAKAVRSKTIEECARVVEKDHPMPIEMWMMPTKKQVVQNFARVVASAIRALNSGKE